jgi:hypothetical protein
MARPERYDREQWELMNRPETQTKFRQELWSWLRRFLDTSPEGLELSRAREVLLLVRKYFQIDYQAAEESEEFDLERKTIAFSVLSSLALAERLLPTDKRLEKMIDDALQAPPPTPEQMEQWERLERRTRDAGLDDWWLKGSGPEKEI